MTSLEDQVRLTLQDMAVEVRPVPLLERLDRDASAARRRRRILQVAVATAAAGIIAGGTLVSHLLPDPGIVEPARHPARVITLSHASTLAPGRAELLLTLGDGEGAYAVPVGTAEAVRLPPTSWAPGSFSEHLSVDGTRVVRQHDSARDPRLEIVDLRTGRTDRLGGRRGYCPWLSPDNDTVAIWDPAANGRLILLDTQTHETRELPEGLADDAACTAHGWSKDGRLLVVGDRDGSSVVDRTGRQIRVLPGLMAVNGSQSWSADSRLLLLYEAASGGYLVHDRVDGAEQALDRPTAALRPLGWAGTRVVWLVGEAGAQSLVTTDREGGDRRLWTTLDVGDASVDSVMWSSDLGGTPRE